VWEARLLWKILWISAWMAGMALRWMLHGSVQNTGQKCLGMSLQVSVRAKK
jgi:hypothetical protein